MGKYKIMIGVGDVYMDYIKKEKGQWYNMDGLAVHEDYVLIEGKVRSIGCMQHTGG